MLSAEAVPADVPADVLVLSAPVLLIVDPFAVTPDAFDFEEFLLPEDPDAPVAPIALSGPVDLLGDAGVALASPWDAPAGVTVDLNGHSMGEWHAFLAGMGGPEGFYMATTGAIWDEGVGYHHTGRAGTLEFYGADGGFGWA